VKTYGIAESPAAGESPIRKRSSRTLGKARRDCITLSDPTDCLLEAYDCVARRAYEHFLARGPRPGGELEDWLSAERELLLDFTINVEDRPQFVYALASIPGATAARLEVGVDSRWLVILALASRAAQVRRAEITWSETRSLGLGLSSGRGIAPSLESIFDDCGPAKSVCILELPATVDAARSIAVLSDGLLAIRMPKLVPRC
jgi:HSP20 family molecular chaperone IbpA